MSVLEAALGGNIRAGTPRLIGLTSYEWLLVAGGAALATVLLAPFYYDETLWVGAAVFVSTASLGHLVLVSNRYMALPGLAGVAASIQWLLAPWLSQLYPASFVLYRMWVPLDTYLAYAVPATVALWLGFHWPVSSLLGEPVDHERRELTRPERALLDVTIVAGLVLATFVSSFPWQAFFLVQIVANFRFFAAACWMVTRTPGWTLRVGAVFVHLLADAAEQTLFYHVVHWGGAFLLLFWLGRRRRWPLLVAICWGIMTLVLFQGVKQDYRAEVELQLGLGKLDSLQRFIAFIGDRAFGEQQGSGQTLGDILVRFNQGWIVSRVMAVVPVAVPYAAGDTIRDAATFTLVPRLLFPGKPSGASEEIFERYTGLPLRQGTSMGLSPLGELYANFGLAGGILGLFVYGTLLGLVVAKFARLARMNVLWWAVAPLVVVTAMEPGWNIEDVANAVVKSGVVVAIAIWGFRPFRRLLSTARPADMSAKPDA